MKLSALAFLRGMAHERNFIIPRSWWTQADKWNDPMTLVGTGPWMFESYQKDVKAVLARLLGEGQALPRQHRAIVLPDRLSLLSAFEARARSTCSTWRTRRSATR
ncbi:MAG: hypothetical protein U0531_21080 [Dehalococcoidia bacterium]